ncbi:MAG: hypothetical protein RLZZ187_108 [Pseudomonadota bacterium]|jgi:hypothetical protein
MRDALPRRLTRLLTGFRRWLTYRPERAYMRGR